jgi:transposase
VITDDPFIPLLTTSLTTVIVDTVAVAPIQRGTPGTLMPATLPPAPLLPPRPAELPQDLATCHALIVQLIEELGKTRQDYVRLEHHLQQLLRRAYGRSAEKLDPNQHLLFAEMLQTLQTQAPAPATDTDPAPQSERKGHGRRKLPADLPRTRVVHELPENEKPCPCCGEVRCVISQQVSEKLDYQPARVSVIEHVQLVYACQNCESEALNPQIVTAEKPLSPIEKSLAAPGLLAFVIVGKYSDHLPLNRLERILGRHDIDISRSTMCDWMAGCAEALTPLYDLMIEQVLLSKVIHTDDTPVDVLDRLLKQTRTGRFWIYLGDEAHPYDIFDYTPSRSRDGPMEFLAGWGKDEAGGPVPAARYLQADAFPGYDIVYCGGKVIEVACWAHARRKFYDARTSDAARSAQAIAHIRLLYDVEDQARELKPAERAALRQQLSGPRLEQFKAWLQSQQAEHGGPVLPKSPMGEATVPEPKAPVAGIVRVRHGRRSGDRQQRG